MSNARFTPSIPNHQFVPGVSAPPLENRDIATEPREPLRWSRGPPPSSSNQALSGLDSVPRMSMIDPQLEHTDLAAGSSLPDRRILNGAESVSSMLAAQFASEVPAPSLPASSVDMAAGPSHSEERILNGADSVSGMLAAQFESELPPQHLPGYSAAKRRNKKA
ncbi:hypothetical protein B0T21DRAFT_372015 [Apiosordaria backusii]|uniref:Uncharacterized protein n=1 Tax=Apiosordaria backusii TaxID=314023 RepID=A0AA40B2Z6_9PEZI|nr:hypothetical protein B0T21DRAFT_372015 [Apiosordaria backusii]